jgi:hypothetical protein
MRQTLPTTSPAEAHAAVDHLRAKGWTEEELAEQILPYMPRPRPPRAGDRFTYIPAGVSKTWLDQHLPSMDREGIRRVVEELERRGWSAAESAVAVLPHLLPKLPPADADAIRAGLKEIGVSAEDIARLSPRD